MPQALILTGMATRISVYLQAGLKSLRWLVKQQTSATGQFRPVGTAGFGETRQPPQPFDQQPLEAAATIAACLAAWRADHDVEWKAEAARVFAWFLGSNDLSVSLVDLETGSCRDGLHPDRANENRGGESVVSYLLGLSEIRQLARLSESRAKPTPLGRLTASAHLSPERNRGHLVAIPVPEPSGASSAARSNTGHRAPVQAGDRAARSQSDGQDPGQPYRRPGSRARYRDRRRQLADVLENFLGRHRNLLQAFEARAEEMEEALADHAAFTQVQRQLVGAYFLNEYSFEASALFNPSIVAHPDQSGTPDGSLRFVLSLRAVGEGHIPR